MLYLVGCLVTLLFTRVDETSWSELRLSVDKLIIMERMKLDIPAVSERQGLRYLPEFHGTAHTEFVEFVLFEARCIDLVELPSFGRPDMPRYRRVWVEFNNYDRSADVSTRAQNVEIWYDGQLCANNRQFERILDIMIQDAKNNLSLSVLNTLVV
jgi:hypothetical protein